MTQFPHLWCTIFCQDILNIWQSAHFKHCNSYFYLQVKWSGADGPDWVELQHWNNSQKKYVLSQSCCKPTLCMQYFGLENTPRCIFQNHTQHLATFTPAYCSFFSHTQYLATFTPAYCRFFLMPLWLHILGSHISPFGFSCEKSCNWKLGKILVGTKKGFCQKKGYF